MGFGHIFHDKEDLFVKLADIQDTIQQEGYNDLNINVELSICQNCLSQYLICCGWMCML